MLALGAEPPAHVIEPRAHRAAVMFRGFVIDDDARSGESGPQRQAGNANKRCLKAIGQSKCSLDSLFAVARDVEVDHHGCGRHRQFRLATIKKGAAWGF
jgi:hypothetical protein